MRKQQSPFRWPRCAHAHVIAFAAALSALAILAGASAAAEFVPSIGITKPVDGGTDAKVLTGLALRNDIAPILMGELAVAYRSESRFDDQLHVRSWPVTASLYLKPVPTLYGGAGVGWYQTTFDYENDTPLLLEDETKQLFGVHVGGGMTVPMSAVGLDLNGRYVMLRDQESRLVPEEFNPDFWTLSLGLAFKF
jgi:hypothetical protein